MSHYWRCPKCGSESYETDQFRAAGGMFAKLFDIQNKRFTTLSCTQCRYTEIYKVDVSEIENILDFFIGG